VADAARGAARVPGDRERARLHAVLRAGKLQACDAFRVRWLLRLLRRHVPRQDQSEPTSGSAPKVTTKAPVFLLKVPAP
jgi:hypothetical protein